MTHRNFVTPQSTPRYSREAGNQNKILHFSRLIALMLIPRTLLFSKNNASNPLL